jgi:alpha-ribazole phosphatase
MAIALVRHLPTALPPGLCYGRLDPPAGPGDPAPILAALHSLAGVPLFSSPARRCQALAAAIATPLGCAVILQDRLLELDFGAWEGLAWDAVPRAVLDLWAADPWGFAPPGGESGGALVARMRQVQAELPAEAIVVAHGGPLKILRQLLAGQAVDLLAPAQPMGSVLVVQRQDCGGS